MKKARVAKQKAQRAKARIRAAQRAKARIRAARPAAAPQVQQAPFPQAFKNNPTAAAAAQYVPGLMVPGNESLGYDPKYGGGGWVAGAGRADSRSIDETKDFYKAMAFTGNKAIGGNWSDIEWAARQYDAGNLGAAGAAPQLPAQTSVPTGSTSAGSRRTGGLAGAGPSLSRSEFENIMRTKGISAEKLLAKASRRGVGLNAGVVNALNKGKLGTGTDSFATYRPFTQGGPGAVSRFPYSLAGMDKESKGFIQGLQGLNLSRGQRYMGSYEADGKRVPVIQTRSAVRGGAGQSGTAGEAAATSGGKVQKLRNKIQKTKALIKSSKSELAARGF